MDTQYLAFGIIFPEGNDETWFDPDAYLTDNVGLEGGPEGRITFITIQFTQPVHSLGVDFPGALRIDLFSAASPVGSSANFGSSGPGYFGGVISDAPFDRAVLSDWLYGDVYIDNLHLTVPAPRLAIRNLGSSSVQLSWTTNAPSFHLEYADGLPATTWSAITNSPISIVGDQFVVTATSVGNQRYFRLHKP